VSQPDSRTAIPIFPLSTVVLFPGADCPLHIFEPRYRQMTREARAGAGLIGMVTVRPEHVGDMAGDPPVFPIGCAGRIGACEELPDGRFNVVLHGAWRFRIASEPARPGGRLYRSALVETLPEAAAESERVRGLRERISQAFARLVARVAPERARQLGPQVVAGAERGRRQLRERARADPEPAAARAPVAARGERRWRATRGARGDPALPARCARPRGGLGTRPRALSSRASRKSSIPGEIDRTSANERDRHGRAARGRAPAGGARSRLNIAPEAIGKPARSDFETRVPSGADADRMRCVRVSGGSRFRHGSKLPRRERCG
jgi:Lon protease-like protein